MSFAVISLVFGALAIVLASRARIGWLYAVAAHFALLFVLIALAFSGVEDKTAHGLLVSSAFVAVATPAVLIGAIVGWLVWESRRRMALEK